MPEQPLSLFTDEPLPIACSDNDISGEITPDEFTKEPAAMDDTLKIQGITIMTNHPLPQLAEAIASTDEPHVEGAVPLSPSEESSALHTDDDMAQTTKMPALRPQIIQTNMPTLHISSTPTALPDDKMNGDIAEDETELTTKLPALQRHARPTPAKINETTPIPTETDAETDDLQIPTETAETDDFQMPAEVDAEIDDLQMPAETDAETDDLQMPAVISAETDDLQMPAVISAETDDLQIPTETDAEIDDFQTTEVDVDRLVMIPDLPNTDDTQPIAQNIPSNSAQKPETHETAIVYADFSEVDIFFFDLITVEAEIAPQNLEANTELQAPPLASTLSTDVQLAESALPATDESTIADSNIQDTPAITVNDEKTTEIDQKDNIDIFDIINEYKQHIEQQEHQNTEEDKPTELLDMPVTHVEMLAEETALAVLPLVSSLEENTQTTSASDEIIAALVSSPLSAATDIPEVQSKQEPVATIDTPALSDEHATDRVVEPGAAEELNTPAAEDEQSIERHENEQIQETLADVTQLTVTEEQPGQETTEIAETPRLLTHESETGIPITPAPVYPAYLAYQERAIPHTPQPTSPPRWQEWRRSVRPHWRVLTSALLTIILLVNALLLGSNIASPHLYLYALNPTSGAISNRQDLGSTQDGITFTAPVSGSSTTLIGTRSLTGQGTQQLLSFTGTTLSTSSTQMRDQQALSIAATGQVLVEGTEGLQVMSAHRQLLWHLQGAQPMLGVHPFQPASDAQNVYAVQSVTQAQITAYTLQTGAVRWTQKLDDTLAYAPPFLLYGNTLYVASDHAIYALNSQDGTVRWKTNDIARTLLMSDATQGQLLAVGAHGVSALDASNGTYRWTFTGQPNSTLTAAQFYQATLANINILATQPTQSTPVVYATGIVWQTFTAREQVWLYAINATNGQPIWSRQVAAGPLSADAARTFQPLSDTTHGLVILQQQSSATSLQVAAYDALKGNIHWQTAITGSNFAAHALVQQADGPILLFTPIFSRATVLLTLSFARLCMLLLFLLSGIGLLAIWFYPLTTGSMRLRSLQKRLTAQARHVSTTTLQLAHLARQQRLSRQGIVAIVLPLLACILTLTYMLLTQIQQSVYLLNTTNGATLWQHAQSQPIQVIGADSQGSIFVTQTPDHLSQVQMRNSDGSIRWQLPSSEGTFSEPIAVPQAGNILLALTGPTQQTSQYAPADPAYLPMLAHTLNLSLLRRSNGQTLWQNVIAAPGEQQSVNVLGADSSYIYVASMQIVGTASNTHRVIQLSGVNITNGNLDWHIFGPLESTTVPYDHGTLLSRPGQAIWQVAGIVYALDTTVGQITWRHPLNSDDPTLLPQEETSMAVIANTLLVTRTDAIHALDLTSGNERWTLPNPGPSTAHSQAGVAVAGQTILVYGNGSLHAFRSSDHHALWSQQQLGSVQGFQLATNDTFAYLAIMNSIDGGTPAPEIIAIDTQNGSIRWTYGLDAQATLASTDAFRYVHGTLLVTLCIPSANSTCGEERLVTLNVAAGTLAWRISGQSISDITVSPDGSSIAYRLMSSPLLSLLRNGA